MSIFAYINQTEFQRLRLKFDNMMKNTRIFFGLLTTIAVVAYTSCTKCPQCPQNNIVTDDADTAYFMIVTDDADTAYVAFAMPQVQRVDSSSKFSIIVDNIDTSRFRIVTDDADATSKKVDIITRLKPIRLNNPKQQN